MPRVVNKDSLFKNFIAEDKESVEWFVKVPQSESSNNFEKI